MVSTLKRESAGEIAKRYGLADLVRSRILARRLYLNSLAKRASISYQDSLDVLDPDMTPLEISLLHSRRYLFLNDPVPSRRSLPAFQNRYAYNRRLAEIEAERMDAEEAAERLMTRFLARPKAKKISNMDGNKEKKDHENKDEDGNNNEEHNEQSEKEDDDIEILDEDLYPDGIDPTYFDYLAYPHDLSTWRHARRLYHRRLSPYRFRPLGITTRLLERRLQDL